MLTFEQLQVEQKEWAAKNFPGKRDVWQPTLGAMEESFELIRALESLARATLKREQGIRGTRAEHEAKARDAVGDIIIYLADLASLHHWSLQAIVEQTWTRVQRRDWRQDPKRGGEGAES